MRGLKGDLEGVVENGNGVFKNLSESYQLPWAIVGALILAGGISTIFYGLPWAKQTDMDRLTQVVSEDHRSIESISQTLAVTAEQQAQTGSILTAIQAQQHEDERNIQSNSMHIEGLEADQKAYDARERLRGR